LDGRVVEIEARDVPRGRVETRNLPVDGLADARHERRRTAARAVVVRRAPGERESRLVLIRAAHLPTAKDAVETARPAAAPTLRTPDWNQHARSDRQAVRPIVGRDAILERSVRGVEVLQLVSRARARVLDRKGV